MAKRSIERMKTTKKTLDQIFQDEMNRNLKKEYETDRNAIYTKAYSRFRNSRTVAVSEIEFSLYFIRLPQMADKNRYNKKFNEVISLLEERGEREEIEFWNALKERFYYFFK